MSGGAPGGGEVIELTQVMRDLITTLNESQRAVESQSAFVEQRNVLQNNGPEVANYQNTLWRGKNFPRGCFGHIHNLEIFARNRAVDDGTITFGFRAFPTGEEITTAIITVPGGTKGLRGAWHSVAIGWDWLYWGMFVYVKAVTENVVYAFDNAEETTSEPEPKSDSYTSPDLGINWAGETDQRYWLRVTMYGQAKGEITVGGRVSVNAINKHVKVVGTDEDGNVTGVLLPLFATTIIGSSEAYFNALAHDEERQKEYSAGDPHTAGWIVGNDFYPYSVAIVCRTARNNAIRPPLHLKYEGIYISITSSDGQRVFTGTLGQDLSATPTLVVIEGEQYWTITFSEGQEDLIYRNIATDVSLTVLVKNSCGLVLDRVEIYILGATYTVV